jgi:hypothetical protein
MSFWLFIISVSIIVVGIKIYPMWSQKKKKVETTSSPDSTSSTPKKGWGDRAGKVWEVSSPAVKKVATPFISVGMVLLWIVAIGGGLMIFTLMARPFMEKPVSADTQVQAVESRVYTGNSISMDFDGADLREVLSFFETLSGKRVIIDPSIEGEVTISMANTPWDQILDDIMRPHNLERYDIGEVAMHIVPMKGSSQRSFIAREGAPVIVTWMKDPDTRGSQSRVRDKKFRCKIESYNSVRFDFTCPLGRSNEITFGYLNNDPSGTWRQPGMSAPGTWLVKRTSAGHFTGWLKNEAGERYVLSLEVIG